MFKLNVVCVAFSLILGIFLCSPLESQDNPKVALLFLTCGELNQSTLWQKLLEQHSDKFNVYIHSKKKIKNRFFAQFVINKKVSTSREYHVNAWKELIQCAFTDRHNVKFVLLSESCFPIQELDSIYEQLTSDNLGYISFRRPFWPARHQREVVELPSKHRWVGSEWVVLNRKQARLVVQDTDVIEACAKHPSDAESYFPTLLSYHGKLKAPDLLNCYTTYTNWELRDGSHPYTFSSGSHKEQAILLEARSEGYLFTRKVEAAFPTAFLRNLVGL